LDGEGNDATFIPFKENQKINPTNSYGLSKMASEVMGMRLGKTYGIPISFTRYSIVQGARQSPRNIYSGALRIFVTQALAGEPITVTEDGNQLRDFVNVEDVARANVLLMENPETNFEIYNVGGGIGYKVEDFARTVKKITNSNSEVLIDGRFRRTDTRNAVSDISKLRSLGWEPQNNPRKSIKDYVDWIKTTNFNVFEIVKKAKEGARELV
jgi:dTDP-L-rhamnose 4-epimerase